MSGQSWASRLEGDYRIQADCGEGYEEIRPVDEYAHYWEPFIPFEQAYAAYQEDIAQVINCDVRIGVFVEGPGSPDPELEVGD